MILTPDYTLQQTHIRTYTIWQTKRTLIHQYSENHLTNEIISSIQHN